MGILEQQRIWTSGFHASEENAPRIRKSLIQFGAPANQIHQDDFVQEGTGLQIGVAPVRIDITTKIDGVEFEDAYSNRVDVLIEDLKVPILSRKDLIRNKRACGRPQDLVDAQMLEQLPEEMP